MISERFIQNLIGFGYDVKVFPSKEAAADYLDNSIDGRRVGFGNSQTLLNMHLHERLAEHNQVYDPAPGWCSEEEFSRTAREILRSEIFICSVNAVAESGELVNIDRRGNRVAGTLFGHDKLYLVIGRNKIVPTLQEAVDRARNVAAPMLTAGRPNWRTPCAQTGKCMDCSSPDRLCNAMVIHFRKMYGYDTEIILVDEDLGY